MDLPHCPFSGTIVVIVAFNIRCAMEATHSFRTVVTLAYYSFKMAVYHAYPNTVA